MNDDENATPVPALLSAPPLVTALNQSVQVRDKVEECVQELSSINAVLTQELTERVPLDVVENALHQSEDVELKVQECADDLSFVNETLSDEIRERKKLESRFSELTDELAEAQSDLSDSLTKEQHARHLSLHDGLTDLPNRNLFNDRLENALALARRHAWRLAVMFIDLDKFKSINDTHGHHAGDRVLKIVARATADGGARRRHRRAPRRGRIPVSHARGQGRRRCRELRPQDTREHRASLRTRRSEPQREAEHRDRALSGGRDVRERAARKRGRRDVQGQAERAGLLVPQASQLTVTGDAACVLAINAGSSSIRFALYDIAGALCGAFAERSSESVSPADADSRRRDRRTIACSRNRRGRPRRRRQLRSINWLEEARRLSAVKAVRASCRPRRAELQRAGADR